MHGCRPHGTIYRFTFQSGGHCIDESESVAVCHHEHPVFAAGRSPCVLGYVGIRDRTAEWPLARCLFVLCTHFAVRHGKWPEFVQIAWSVRVQFLLHASKYNRCCKYEFICLSVEVHVLYMSCTWSISSWLVASGHALPTGSRFAYK